jgi:hypothetical protein
MKISIAYFFRSILYYIFLTFYKIKNYIYEIKTIEPFNPEKEYIRPIFNKFQKFILENGENDDKNSNIDPIFYQKKEFNEFMKEPNNSLESTWKKRILIEFSPRGNIIMFYDAYKMGFAYYCDQNVISYDILNAVAMKYVMTYRCFSFFIDELILPDSEPNRLKFHYLEDKKESKQNDSFIKLKNYTSTISEIKKEDDKMKNKFLYLGNIRNFKISQLPEKNNKLNNFNSKLLSGFDNLSYTEFKLLMEEKKKQSISSIL